MASPGDLAPPKPSSGDTARTGPQKLREQVTSGSLAAMSSASGPPTAAAKKLKPEVVPGASGVGSVASKVIRN